MGRTVIRHFWLFEREIVLAKVKGDEDNVAKRFA
jgi:hypothetical protein